MAIHEKSTLTGVAIFDSSNCDIISDDVISKEVKEFIDRRFKTHYNKVVIIKITLSFIGKPSLR